MLDYLVTSRVRRELLRLVWGENRSGSVSELARAAKVNFSAAHRELEGMLEAGLVATERQGAELLYRQAADHPEARLLRQLARVGPESSVRAKKERLDSQNEVRRWLSSLGAPLAGSGSAAPAPAVERVVADALVLAHSDATVARVLPFVLWRQRASMNLDRLVEHATKQNEGQALGYFLEMAGSAGKGSIVGERSQAPGGSASPPSPYVLLRTPWPSRRRCCPRQKVPSRQTMGVFHECRRRQLPVAVRQVGDGLIVFPRTEIERFLRAVDKALATGVDLIVIGGGAATLHYGALRATHDIDTLTHASTALDAAAAQARAVTGLGIPIQTVTIADEPEDFASRMERVLPRLRRLRVFVPERHDLVLMKATRAYEHDIQVIREIHENAPLHLETLVDRFVNEMSPIGHPVRIRRNFLTAIEALFPDRVDEVERHLRGR